jgi:hypothetical protein
VFEELFAAAEKHITWRDITDIQSPRLYDDILVLPIAVFGTRQRHSRSTVDEAEDALVKHQFKDL